ncbi:MAG: hypothetical protein NVSMB27_09620 [Ktedonobacteraceae bacterium]
MPSPFAELYTSLLKNDVFTLHAREDMAQGADGLTCALAYAEQGKPEFTLAYLLLIDISEQEKHEILALSYDRRATISEEKAEQFDQQFHRPFPLIKLEAQKDRLAAQQVRQGRRVRREGAANRMLRVN